MTAIDDITPARDVEHASLRVYGRLSMSAVVAVHDFPCGQDGGFRLPSTVEPDRP